MVREIKGKTEKPYEKPRLIVQGYNDAGKENILTQSPTIQRVSQRIIAALAPTFVKMSMAVELRDVTQAYPQSKSELARVILAHLPKELEARHPPGTIMRLVKAGVHWWNTYHRHHREANFDVRPCLLITIGGKEAFGVVGMQTDDTLMLSTPPAVFGQTLKRAGHSTAT